MTKTTLNIMKVGMHSYLPNVQVNLQSNFNLEKLVKRETSLGSFSKVVLRGGENISERCGILHAHLSIKWAPKYMIKIKF